MFDQLTFGREFFATLESLDLGIARRVAASRCPVCGGPLHAGNFLRKPRGALVAPEGEAFVVRFTSAAAAKDARSARRPRPFASSAAACTSASW